MRDPLVQSLVFMGIVLRPLEGNALFDAFRVSKSWRQGIEQQLLCRGVLKSVFKLLVASDDGCARVVNFIYKKGYKTPAMFTEILKETLWDTAHLKAFFLVDVKGIHVVLHLIRRYMAYPRVLNGACLILQMFDTVVGVDIYAMKGVAQLLVSAHEHNAHALDRPPEVAQEISLRIVETVKKLSVHNKMPHI